MNIPSRGGQGDDGQRYIPRPRGGAPVARIREGTFRDLDLLVRHRRLMMEAIWHPDAEVLDALDRRYRRWMRTRMRSRRFVAFLVEDRGRRIAASGAVWLMPLPPRPLGVGLLAPYLMSMYTEPEDRGKGYATLVVRAAIRWAESRGYRALYLHASPDGRHIYERAGFQPTPEMRLRLDTASAGTSRRPPRKRSPTKKTAKMTASR